MIRLSGATLAFAACGMLLTACGGGPVASATPQATPTAPVKISARPSGIPIPTASATPTASSIAGSPSSYLNSWPYPPACPTSAADASVCAISPFLGGSQRASTSEYLLIHVGWQDPTQQSCAKFASNTSTTITIDGRTVASVNVGCQFVSNAGNGSCSNQWRFDTRYLSPPLAFGSYKATATVTYHGSVSGASTCTGGTQTTIAAGTVQTPTATIVVS